MKDKKKNNSKLWEQDEDKDYDDQYDDDEAEDVEDDEIELEDNPDYVHPDSPVGLSIDDIYVGLSNYTLARLKDLYWTFLGTTATSLSKSVLCSKLTDFLSFNTQAQFDHFFLLLPKCIQEAISIGVNSRYVPVKPLEDKYSVSLIEPLDTRSYYYEERKPEHRFRANMFIVFDPNTLFLPEMFRRIFRPWIPLPPEAAATSLASVEGQPWSNTESLEEVLPLLVDAIGAPIVKLGVYETAHKGLTKQIIRSIRQACGQREFPLASKYGLDSVELATRFIASIEGKIPKRQADSDTYAKYLLQRFFFPSYLNVDKYNYLMNSIESNILIDYLKTLPGYGSSSIHPFGFRSTFAKVLISIAPTGAWFDVDQLCRAEYIQNRLLDEKDSQSLGFNYVKGESLTIGEQEFTLSSYQKGFVVVGRLQYPLLELPLFKAYCYLMAVLGIVDIIETEPVLALQSNGKKIPISPYDALSHIRVNPLGAWCLGVSKTRPLRVKYDFETITDEELLLVTFRGKSLERKLFLEQIGQPLGEERYRISETTFARGCKNLQEISKRIERFKELLNPLPSKHWLKFFTTILSRAIVFTVPQPCLMFDMPSDPALKQQIMDDPQLRKLMIRAEGNRIVILSTDIKNFQKLLVQRGFLDVEIL